MNHAINVTAIWVVITFALAGVLHLAAEDGRTLWWRSGLLIVLIAAFVVSFAAVFISWMRFLT